MANARELKKLAEPRLDPLLLPIGFRKGRGCSYFRITEDGVYQIVEIIPSRYGSPRLWFTCTIPQLHAEFEEKTLPPKDTSYYVGGELGSYTMINGEWVGYGYCADTSKETGMIRFMDSLPGLIEKWVLPMFSRLLLREQLWAKISAQFPENPNIMNAKSAFLSPVPIWANNSLEGRRP